MKEKTTKVKIKKLQKNVVSQGRLLLVLSMILILFVCLVFRIGYFQFVRGAEYKEITARQSTSSKMISAKRGNIYDANNKALALSADVDTISCNPKSVAIYSGSDINQEKTKALKANMAKKMAEIFDVEEEAIYKKLNSNNSYETLVSKVEQDKVDEFQKWLKENEVTNGINIDKDTKRYYPFDNLASNVIGFCGSSGSGLDGIELSYDSVLSGTSGRLTTSISSLKSVIPDSDEEYIAPEDGSNVYLTIDSNMQSIVEKYLKQACIENNTKNGGTCIIMDPKTGAIKAMATYPDYNLNTPYVPNSNISKDWDSLSSSEQTNRLYGMWRNRAVLDTYEPGSTFKTITTSIGLEENLVETDTPGDFSCSGYMTFDNDIIRCSARGGHGSQTLRQALENSCNPAFMQLGRRIGTERFYNYLEAFGFFENTGVDLPSEGTSSFWAKENVGPTELATMSFGQRFTITPLQLVRAVSAIVNEGVLVTPHVVDRIENPNTGTITTIETTETRQVISEETSDKVKNMMKDVVEIGGGRYAKVQGYEIGGKTGTSEPRAGHESEGYVASFIAIAPVEDTKLVCLLTLYGPTSGSIYGGRIAAPAVSQILSEVLPYMEIPSDTKTTKTIDKITVPNLKGKSVSEATKTLEGLGLKVSTSGQSSEIVTAQNPVGGAQLIKDGVVKVYTSEHNERVKTTVPNLKGVTLEQAKNMLKSKNLNVSYSGSGIVIAQDPTASAEIEEGSIVTVTLQAKTSDYEN